MRRQKTLTVMFTDISGFTKHTETVTRDELMARLDEHNALLMPIVRHFEGRIVKSIGDALMIVFESPTNAVQCGMLMQHRLARHNRGRVEFEQIHIKVSLNAGEVTVTENDVFGDCVNVAAKIEKATRPDEIYFTESVFLAMNKAEVPNVFVKNFRPKGEQSHEIKLYKVIQDVTNEQYARLIRDTDIKDDDPSDALELSDLAGSDLPSGHDSLAELIADERARSRKNLLLATALGALLLGGLVVGGLALFSGSKGPTAADRTTDAVRAYLAKGNVEGARSAIANFGADGGSQERIAQLQREIHAYQGGESVKRIKALLADDNVDDARSLVGSNREFIPTALLTHIDALAAAEQALRDGDAEAARKGLQGADPTFTPRNAYAACKKRIEAIDTAWHVHEHSESVDDAERAIEVLSGAFGDDTHHPVATRILGDMIIRSVGMTARTSGRKAIREHFDALMKRFPGIKDRTRIRREVQLHALWFYTSDYEARRRWRGRFDSQSQREIATLRELGKGDADFLFRLGVTRHRISRKNGLGISDGAQDIESAMKLDPRLIETRADELYPIAIDWLRWVSSPDSLAHKLVTGPFKERAREHLFARAFAPYGGKRDDAPRPEERANAVAALVAMNAPIETEQAVEFVTNNWKTVLTGRNPIISIDVFAALFARKDMAYEYFERLAGDIKRIQTELGAKRGKFSAYKHARDRILALRRTLIDAHPAHAKRFAAN